MSLHQRQEEAQAAKVSRLRQRGFKLLTARIPECVRYGDARLAATYRDLATQIGAFVRRGTAATAAEQAMNEMEALQSADRPATGGTAAQRPGCRAAAWPLPDGNHGENNR